MTDMPRREARSLATALDVVDRYRLMVDSVRDYAIFALDPSGHILTWNVGAQRIKGYAPAEIIGRHFSVFYPPEAIKAGLPESCLRHAAADGRFEMEDWRLRKDGTRFWADVVITALRDESGQLVGFAKVTRDLTERRLAEQALRESEQRFRLLIEGVADYGIFMLDTAGYVASWNEGARRISGYSSEEIIGRHLSTFYPPDDVASGKPEWELEVAAREGRFEEEGWRVRKDGSHFWASVLISALRNSDGVLEGFGKVTRDLTERRAAQERSLADARRVAEAEAANRAKSEFLTAMSHELRTPLNAIGGYADLLVMGLGGPVTSEQRQFLDRIRRSQQHLLAIITDLLNFSRIEAGTVVYGSEPVPFDVVVDAVLPMVEPQAATKRVDLRRGTCLQGTVALADHAKVEQILLNLLSNAIKFTPAGGGVTVSCARGTADFVELCVSDTGPGVPNDKREVIFEAFVQLGRTLTSPQEGTGLGLAISRDLARAMGGDLTVADASDGQGATFTLKLPAA